MNKPVTILTGFLGAGKTTFLNHLLKENKEKKYAIIENEFGEQGIDNELVVHPDETIVELNNGCLCCTLNDNLYDILNDLFERRDEFDELIIEATGVADPTGLAQPFLSHPLIKEHFPLTAIICLIDAELIEQHIEETEEALNQIIFSDVLLINKIDLVSEHQVSSLEDRLRTLNPLADIVKGNKEGFPQIEYRQNSEKLQEILQLGEQVVDTGEQLSFPVQKPHSHHHHKHTEEINSQTYTFDQPFDYKRLYQQLFVYLTFQSKDLYRMKGLIWIENEAQQYIFQSVGKRLDVQTKRPWLATEPKKSVIVFIGKQLKREGLERLLQQCLSDGKQVNQQTIN
ncbi:MAG: CobW family GTP-binding protein [Thermonemataceae bacterium]